MAGKGLEKEELKSISRHEYIFQYGNQTQLVA